MCNLYLLCLLQVILSDKCVSDCPYLFGKISLQMDLCTRMVLSAGQPQIYHHAGKFLKTNISSKEILLMYSSGHIKCPIIHRDAWLIWMSIYLWWQIVNWILLRLWLLRYEKWSHTYVIYSILFYRDIIVCK